jgi:thiosulfate/3-mercaptopyruvate sulfurtransferase
MKKLGLLVVLVTAPAWAQAAKYANAQLLAETPELAAEINDPQLRLVDARPAAEYQRGHLPGAVDIPALATDDLEANRQGYPLPPAWAQRLFRMAGINAGTHVVVYDDQGNRFAARLFYVLEFFGATHVQVLNGGFRKWQSEGRALTVNSPAVPPGDFTVSPHSALIATPEWLAAHLKDVKIVDARSPAEYRGEERLGPRGGHIPGAVNIEWTRIDAAGGIPTFLAPAALAKLFSDAGVAPGQEVVTYCEMGARAAAVYFALRLLGYRHVRVYDGSWEDWSSQPQLPVEP